MVTVHPSEKMKPEISHGESYRVESRGNSMPIFSCHLVSVSMVFRGPYTVLLHEAPCPGFLWGLVMWY